MGPLFPLRVPQLVTESQANVWDIWPYRGCFIGNFLDLCTKVSVCDPAELRRMGSGLLSWKALWAHWEVG